MPRWRNLSRKPREQNATLRRAVPVTASESATGPIVRLVTGVIAFALICAAGASAYRYFGWTWGDGIYMVIITIFTVGYAEVRPVESPELRSVTMAVIVFGYAATLLIVSGLAQLVLDGELRHNLEMRRMIRNIESLRGHIIICGYGRMGRRLASKLRGRRDILVIDLDEDKLAEAAEDGFMVLRGNASEEDLLRAAGIEYASVLVAVIPDDATCLFTTITARGLNRELKILSRGEQPSTVQKLRQVGADHVVLTAAIGADRLCQLILRPTAAAMLRNDELPSGLIEDLESIGLAMDELTFKSQSSLCGRTLAELTVRGKNSFLIVALRRCDGTMMVNPSVETKVEAGDTVMVLGHEGDIHTLCHQFQLHRNEELVAERSAEPLEPTVVEETASPTTDADDVTESATHQTTTSTAESTLSANSRGQA